MNSRDKGKRGELEFAGYLRDRGIAARRGQQFAGGQHSPDVVADIPGVHFEVKRVERGSLYHWLAQAQRDAGDNFPVVAHRRSRGDWIAILPMQSLLTILRSDAVVAVEATDNRDDDAVAEPETW